MRISRIAKVDSARVALLLSAAGILAALASVYGAAFIRDGQDQQARLWIIRCSGTYF